MRARHLCHLAHCAIRLQQFDAEPDQVGRSQPSDDVEDVGKAFHNELQTGRQDQQHDCKSCLGACHIEQASPGSMAQGVGNNHGNRWTRHYRHGSAGEHVGCIKFNWN